MAEYGKSGLFHEILLPCHRKKLAKSVASPRTHRLQKFGIYGVGRHFEEIIADPTASVGFVYDGTGHLQNVTKKFAPAQPRVSLINSELFRSRCITEHFYRKTKMSFQLHVFLCSSCFLMIRIEYIFS